MGESDRELALHRARELLSAASVAPSYYWHDTKDQQVITNFLVRVVTNNRLNEDRLVSAWDLLAVG